MITPKTTDKPKLCFSFLPLVSLLRNNQKIGTKSKFECIADLQFQYFWVVDNNRAKMILRKLLQLTLMATATYETALL